MLSNTSSYLYLDLQYVSTRFIDHLLGVTFSNVKVHPCTGTEALYRPYGHRGSRGITLPFHDHGTWRGWGVSVTPRQLFTPGKNQYPLYRRLGGPQGLSGQVRKISPAPGFNTWTVQPVASRYTDYAVQPTRGGGVIFCKVGSSFWEVHYHFLWVMCTLSLWYTANDRYYNCLILGLFPIKLGWQH